MHTEAAPARGPGRPRKDNEAAAPVEQAAPAPIRLIEVKLVRKYVPTHLYERDEERTVPPQLDKDDKLVAPGQLVVKPIIKPDGTLVVERTEIEGEIDDKFGRKVAVYKQIMTSYPAGTIISLPAEEAERALHKGIAVVTTNTFSFAA
jgi:hypothetical protein